MNNTKLAEILRQGYLVIPLYLFKNYSKLKISLEEFFFLLYIGRDEEKIQFDPASICEQLGFDLAHVMEMIDTLSDRHFISVETVKNESGLMEEVIHLDGFYDKISSLMREDIVKTDHSNSDIFNVIEKEFGRTLSPMEYEIIKAWLDNDISEELIKEALKEATFNGVSNLRYIDKILYEWGKIGIQTKEDVLKNKMDHRKKKESEKAPEIFDYDWFDDDE